MTEPVTKTRAWQRMLSGRRLDLLAPRAEDIEISDIAHGLARVARWNGQTIGDHAFSVAQHSLIVEEITAARHPDWAAPLRLASLLHDAAEYVVGDLISPFKAAIGYDYKSFETMLLGAIHKRFRLPWPLPIEIIAAIKHADQTAAYFEATRLAGFSPQEGELYFGFPTGLPAPLSQRLERLAGIPTPDAERDFLRRFADLDKG